MKTWWSLTRLYFLSFYNLPGKTAPSSKLDFKSIAKAVGIAALVLIVVVNFGVLFVTMNMSMYDSLAPAGMQGLMLLNAAITATILTLVVGFLMALSTYFLNDMELQFLAMPIKPWVLFGAKFTAVYASEAVFALFFMVAAMVIFGIKEGPHPLFYLWGTLAGLLLPLPVLAATYLIQVPLLSIARFLKNKQIILLVGGLVGLAFALGFNIYYQTMMVRIGDPAWLAEHFTGPRSLLARIGAIYPPSLLVWRAMTNPASTAAFIDTILLALLCLGSAVVMVLLLARAYVESLIGFNEAHLRKLGKAGADAFIAARLRRSSPFLTMVLREVHMMNREPMYLLNGPFVIVLMPVIMGIMLAVQKDALLSDPDMAGIMAMLNSGAGAMLAALVGAFLGSGTSITCTALSRDAKVLPYIKSLPIKASHYLLAKLAHGMLFAAFGSLVGVAILAWAIELPLSESLVALAVALALSTLFNMAGLWLDTANPRLRWDNPIAAMKQNPNAVIAILGAMGILGGIGYLVITTGMDIITFGLLFCAAPLAVLVALLAAYPRYATRRLAALEA
jgi:ABC-2 type transport system permease protein